MGARKLQKYYAKTHYKCLEYLIYVPQVESKTLPNC